jgi:hypothetical protein
MTHQNFLSRLNWRQILTHFLAFWFFIHAFETLSYLYNIRLLDTVRHSNSQDFEQKFIDNNVSAADLTYFVFWTNTSGFIGLIVAFVISLAISIKRHWFWLNSLVVLIVTYALYRFDLLGWSYLKKFFWRFGQTFSDIKIELIVNGALLLIIGLLIFFLKRPNTFIENRKLATS